MSAKATPSQQLAIAMAAQEAIGNRQGQRAQPPHTCAEVAKGSETRSVAARTAGFQSREAMRRVKAAVDSGVPELVEAMDRGEVTISAAATVAKAMPAERQRELLAQGPRAVAAAAAQIRASAAAPHAPPALSAAAIVQAAERADDLAGWVSEAPPGQRASREAEATRILRGLLDAPAVASSDDTPVITRQAFGFTRDALNGAVSLSSSRKNAVIRRVLPHAGRLWAVIERHVDCEDRESFELWEACPADDWPGVFETIEDRHGRFHGLPPAMAFDKLLVRDPTGAEYVLDADRRLLVVQP